VPVILRVKGYRFWFYQADLEEPPHVHVGKQGREAKFWLQPIAVARAGRFREQELREAEGILIQHLDVVLEAWQRELGKRGHGEG